jgi:hypothetical protein
MYLSRATCESMDRADFRRRNPINKDGSRVWPPKGYVFANDPKSYHNDPAQQHGSIAEDLLRKETIARLEAEKNND